MLTKICSCFHLYREMFFDAVALCRFTMLKQKQLQKASLLILAALHFRRIHCFVLLFPFVINTVSSSQFKLIFLFRFCGHFSSFLVLFFIISQFLLSGSLLLLLFLLLSESSSMFFQSFSIPAHPFLVFFLSFTQSFMYLASGDKEHLCLIKYTSANQCIIEEHLTLQQHCDVSHVFGYFKRYGSELKPHGLLKI